MFVRGPLLATLGFFVFLCLLDAIPFGALETIVGLAHQFPLLSRRSEDLDLHGPLGWDDWVCTRLLCDAIQAVAVASVSKLLTVVGLVSGIEIFTLNPPASSGTTS